jgi:hypothetical protein
MRKPEEKIFYFGWVYGTGHVTFGFHGTEREWEAKKLLDPNEDEIKLIENRYIYTEAEHQEYLKSLK